MNHLVIASARSRSTFLLRSLSNFHKIENYGELYNDQRSYVASFVRTSNMNFDALYRQRLRIVNNRMFSKNNFAVKLIPSACLWNPFNGDESMITEDSLKHLYTDITDLFEIPKFDYVYLLYRKNVVDYVLSYMNSYNSKIFQYTSPLDFKRNPVKAENMVITDYPRVDKLLLPLALVSNFETYLKEKNIPHTTLEYDEVPDFVKNNFPNADPGVLENNFNYKEMAPNYDATSEYLLKRYEELSELAKKIVFY